MSKLSIGKKRIALVISTLGQVPEALRVAQVIRDSAEFSPIFYVNLAMSMELPAIRRILNSGFDLIEESTGFHPGELIENLVESKSKSKSKPIDEELVQAVAPKNPFVVPANMRSIKDWVKSLNPDLYKKLRNSVFEIYRHLYLLGFFYRAYYKNKRFKQEKRILQNFQIALIVLFEDSEDYYTQQLVRLGHMLDIKSLVFPYTFANQFEFLEDAYFLNRTATANPFNWLAATLFPKWSYFYKGKRLIKSSPSLIFAAELFGDAPPNPWVMSSGNSDVIAVESEFMKNYYAVAGIPASQMRVVGYPSLDVIARANSTRAERKAEIAQEIGNIRADKFWIVCAVPPSQWPRRAVGFDTYQEFLKSYVRAFEKVDRQKFDCIFKFHPRYGDDEIQAFCKMLGIGYTQKDTSELVALADVFVATSSSTIRWPLALGIPTINYDTYGYGYQDFEGAANYKTIVSYEEFVEAVVQTSEQVKLNASKVCQSYYGEIDGKSGERIIRLFSELSK